MHPEFAPGTSMDITCCGKCRALMYPTLWFCVHAGSVVTVRAVKLLHKIENPDDPDTRDAWWNEIRDEIRSHASSLGHTAVIGYNETTSISDNLCLLSATGTAATVNTDPSQGVAYSYRGSASSRMGLQGALDVSPLDLSEVISDQEVPCHAFDDI